MEEYDPESVKAPKISRYSDSFGRKVRCINLHWLKSWESPASKK